MDPTFFHTAMIWNENWPLDPVFRKALEAGDIEERDGNYFQVFGIPGKPSCLAFNCPEIDPVIDVTQPDFQTRAIAEGRRAILRLIRFTRKYLPGFEKAFITQSAVLLGVRESRRISGEYVLTGKDILTHTKFEDAIARCNYPIDIHGPLGAFEKIHRPDIPDDEKFYEVPYRCLVPKKVENLLVAGRCLSADFVGQSSARIQPTCRAFGEAAGLASVLSLNEGISPRALDGRKVREVMKSAGAFL
jgi:hypothetical protein